MKPAFLATKILIQPAVRYNDHAEIEHDASSKLVMLVRTRSCGVFGCGERAC